MAVGVPATLHSIYILRYWGTKKVQTWGHAGISISALVVAILWRPLSANGGSGGRSEILFTVYLLFYFAVNWGAKMGAFVLPQEVYKPEFRSTFTGIAAASGKLGAIVGIWIFEVLGELLGVVPVMLIVAALSALGALISHTCISDELWAAQSLQMAEKERAAMQTASRGSSDQNTLVETPTGAEVLNPIS
mmetsp:Transcript_57425/g.98910  ORF Transcript_57425/g.98910 Transcript_57425/m.98910 type:complete len:191 (+) Transcript_57425:2-574(+)